MDFTRWKYRNGTWTWSNVHNRLLFVNNVAPIPSRISVAFSGQSILTTRPQTLGCTHGHLLINFRESIDSLEQIRFRRHYRRKTLPGDPDVITIQDIRDVVLFTIPPNQLSVENIKYFHTPAMDFLLRTLIIYFQYFMQVWDIMMRSKEEAQYKLFQPSILKKEEQIHDELSDLRAMVSRAYFIFLIGADDAKKFHHIKSNKTGISQGEKDVRFIEFLYQICTRVVWIALLKRNRYLIEMEVNRMLRSDTYNIIARSPSGAKVLPILKEFNHVLYGQCNAPEKKLLQRSNIGKEIFYGDHDFRLLAIGNTTLQNVGERITYLDNAYSAPEEDLVALNVPVGILGYPRSDFDEMLTLRYNRNDDGSVKVWPKMILPEKSFSSIRTSSLKSIKKDMLHNQIRAKIRNDQCAMWINYKCENNETLDAEVGLGSIS